LSFDNKFFWYFSIFFCDSSQVVDAKQLTTQKNLSFCLPKQPFRSPNRAFSPWPGLKCGTILWLRVALPSHRSVAALGRAPHYSGSTRVAQRWKEQWRLSAESRYAVSWKRCRTLHH
jgi:hypothetical protein